MNHNRTVLDRRPDAVLVVGDSGGTLACGLVTARLGRGRSERRPDRFRVRARASRCVRGPCVREE